MDGLEDFLNSHKWYEICTFDEKCKCLCVSDIYPSAVGVQSTTSISTLPEPSVSSEKEVDLRSVDDSPYMRVVWIERVKQTVPWHYNIPEKSFEFLIENFQIREAYSYAQTAVAGFHALQPASPAQPASFCFFMPDLFGVSWSYEPDSGQTRAIWWGGPWTSDRAKSLVSHMRSLYTHPLMLAVVGIAVLTHVIDRDLAKERQTITELENRTGHHPWKTPGAGRAKGSRGELFAGTSANATALAGFKRICRVNDEMIRCVNALLEKQAVLASHSIRENCQDASIRNTLELLQQRVNVQHVQLEFLCKRVEVQQATLYHLITQQQASVGLATAKDSRSLALANKHDSSSMKTLAAMTVTFLPGTFLASLFAMPLFKWDAQSSNNVVSRRFWIYWAAAIPMSVLTVLIWLYWTKRQTALFRFEASEGQAQLSEDIEENG